ncbi:MAG TPA: VTT domain-containing protein [Terriglobales bacterium]|nr:VTT domain-containing protein [Terriglobales bacterium]
MDFLKHILAKYTAFLWGLMAPLGSWAVFTIAFADAAFVGIPMDPLVAAYVYKFPQQFWLYPVMGAVGSALGSTILYGIGWKGGQLVLAKRVSPQRMASLHNSFERHPAWALMLPSMLPPPTPFKLFVLAAGVFRMPLGEFLLAIIAGRMARYTILSVLTVLFGERVVHTLGDLFRNHFGATLGAIGVVILLVILYYRLRRSPVAELAD